GYPDPRAVGQSRWHVQREQLVPRLELVAAARRTPRLGQCAEPAAVGARLGEDHVPACRLHHAGAVAVDTALLRRLQNAGALAHSARLLARDADRPIAAADRLL